MELTDMLRPDSGCTLANNYAVFRGIFELTGGNPCGGCGYYNGCEFLQKQSEAAHARRVRNFGQHSHETNTEISKRMGVSKRQVAKMRKNKEL